VIDSANWVLAGLTAVLVLITLYYALTTARILKANERMVMEMKEQHDAMMRPYLVISPFITQDSQLLNLKIKNTGKTGALHVRLNMDKDFYKFGNKGEQNNLRSLALFSSPIACIAPGGSFFTYLSTGPLLFGKENDSEVSPVFFTVTAEYSWGCHTVTEETAVDLRPFLGTTSEPDDLLVQVKDVGKNLGTLTSQIRRLADQLAANEKTS